MKRSLSGLVVALSLFACSEEPRGKLEPIPRPPGMPEAPKPAEAPAAPTPPPVDPAKVVLRWKLAPGAPASYRLTLERGGSAPAADEPAPEKPAKDRKQAKEEPAPAPSPVAAVGPSALTYVMERTDSGDYRLRVVPEGSGAAPDQGTLSERGFVLDGLQGTTRNLAMLVLELPRDPVGLNDTWSLATELVTPDAIGPMFQPKQSDRRNRVKLTALTPGDGGEQVAAVEYDLYEKLSGMMRLPRPPPKVPARELDEEEEAGPARESERETEAGTEVRISGRGEFLVKAGRWRSWEGTLSSTTKGPFPATAVQVPAGSLKLRLTAVEAAPAPTPTAQPQQ